MVSRRPALPARAIAAHVLSRVWDEDAFAAAALDAELRREPDLDPREAGLATELVYGVLRTQRSLEESLAAFARSKTYAKDSWVRAHLLMGAYSLTFLDRIPTFAAVDEAARGIGERADPRVVGFANAVLRKLADRLGASGKRPGLSDAAVASAPPWLRGELRRSLGRSEAVRYLVDAPVPPPIGICLALGEDRETWVATLRGASPTADIQPGGVSPRAITLRGAGDVRRLPGAGVAWIVQEEGAQAVALALGARPGERVLDACAGRGNKVWILGQGVAPGGAVDAADLYPAKLEVLRRGPLGRLCGTTFPVDWTSGTGDVPGGYDRVLVDAPCSGVGTLRRRPEIAIRRSECDLAALSDLQVNITLQAATRARDGGRLVYAVCSVLRAEAEEVVLALVARTRDDVGQPVRLEPAPFDSERLRELGGEDITALRLLPHVHGTDGYFVASFVVRHR